ncbi:MAG: TetR/AcrR family transcriptional regulator [Erysipelotrichaceae bacterium]|nr:TetR/AcrR family transcriptional regulator [Erysipelotrichaceae bacterium]
MTQKSELEKRNIVRLSNKEAKQATRNCLQSALVTLLKIKDIDDISVSELTRKAGVSRTAFYSNYQTIDEVLSEMINDELTEINRSVWKAINEEEDLFTQVMQKMKDRYDFYSIILRTNIEKTAFFQMRDYIRKEYPYINTELYYLIIAGIGSIRGIVLEWYVNGCSDSVEFISDICRKATGNLKEKILTELSKDKQNS